MYKREYATWDWLKYTIFASWCFGISNACVGLLASKFELYGIALLSFGQLLNCIIYHAINPTDAYKLSKLAKIAVMLRALTHFGLMIVTFSAFHFADRAQINQGVISALFTSGVAFSAILFFFVFSERIRIPTLLGMAMITTGVVCVGLKQPDNL